MIGSTLPRALVAALALVSLAAPAPARADSRPAAPPDRYRIDPAHTAITAQVAFFGLATKTAGFPAVSGTIALDPARADAVALSIVLDARQLTAGDPVTLARLKGPNFFAVAQYPEIRFTGTHMDLAGSAAARITGTLTARGVTRPLVLAVRFDQPPRHGRPITLSATTTINRREFGMTAYRFIVGSKVRIAIAARLTPE
ncbi:MAG TPA: YceI family protein [Novosphingobium sp.]|nr:YceI family protein [Novosphingobium sp.]